MINEDVLWDLVEKWRAQAVERVGGHVDMPYLSPTPPVAHAQGLTAAAEDLSDLILDSEEAEIREKIAKIVYGR